MFGIESYFNCPSCDYDGKIDLGVTNFVKIKNIGEDLAVTNCPNCNKPIAFKIVQPKQAGDFYTDYNGDAAAISCVENTILSMTKEELKNEEEVKEKVLVELNKTMGELYVARYYIEIVQLIEIIALNQQHITQKGYDISIIDKKDIELTGCACY